MANVAPQDVFDVVGQVLSLDPTRVTPESRIGEIGFDSLMLVELVIELQDRFGVDFDHDDLAGLYTVGDLVGLINAKG